MLTEGLAIWIGALLTLFILSFLYRDNPFFRFAESIFTGVSLGYYIGNVFDQTLVPNLFIPLLQSGEAVTLADRIWLFGSMAVGVLLYARYVPQGQWLARWALAIYVGYHMGLQMMQKLQGEVQPQAADTIISLGQGVGGAELLNNLVIVVGVLTVLVYFFFSAEHKGALGGISRVGIWFLMVSFGAAFGYTIMGRVSILIGRINFLVTEWLGIG